MPDFEFQKYIRHAWKCLCVHGRHLQANRIQPVRKTRKTKRPLYKSHALGYMLINPPTNMISNQEMHPSTRPGGFNPTRSAWTWCRRYLHRPPPQSPGWLGHWCASVPLHLRTTCVASGCSFPGASRGEHKGLRGVRLSVSACLI